MFGLRRDIVGDLFRLRQELGLASREPDAPDRYHYLEVLAAVAVAQGVSCDLVTKASLVARDRIEALVQLYLGELEQLAEEHGYERDASGVVARRDR